MKGNLQILGTIFFYWFGNLSETSNTIMLIIYKDEPLPQLRHSCT